MRGCLLVLATHVPLGIQVLRRGIVIIDLAVAQIAGLGVIVAGFLGWEDSGWTAQLAVGGAAVLGAALLTWTERRWPEVQEAQIGVVFVLAASGSLLLLARHPQGGEHLRELLAGQILWVGWPQIGAMAGVTAVIALLWWLLRGAPSRLAFYVVFALAVTASVFVDLRNWFQANFEKGDVVAVDVLSPTSIRLRRPQAAKASSGTPMGSG